jgi:hypothetical protein
MDADDIPPVPAPRIAAGERWRTEWERAHREMAPWRRRPRMHLIDELLRRDERGWLRDQYDWIASTTHMPGGTAQDDGGTRWHRTYFDTATMRTTTVRVVLGTDGTTIATAFPISPWRSSPTRT